MKLKIGLILCMSWLFLTQTYGQNLAHTEVKEIYFTRGSDQLNEAAKRSLDEYAKAMKTHPKLHLKVAAYMDAIEFDKRISLELSEDRAIAVLDYLEKKGISRDRFRAHFSGVSCNLYWKDGLFCRRVELTFIER